MIKTLILTTLMFSLNAEYSTLENEKFELESKEYSIDNFQDSYDESQLIGTWYFLSKDNDSKSKTENLTEGKSLIIKTDHKFESDIFEDMENGSWKFEQSTQELTLETENKNSTWKLKKVNDFGMVLINIETNEKWIFAA